MKCPFCGHVDTQVIDSRVNEDGSSIRRRRRCLKCEKRFTTFENADVRMPQVVKTGGHRAEFEQEKVRTSFLRALHKRPVSTTLVDEAIDRICHRLLQLGEREVSSRQVGEMVMTELARLDKVAYVRFASVYRSFEDVAEFNEAIEEIQNNERK
jgi:transcriptional repressor NrdR